jgi:hypothetical protein
MMVMGECPKWVVVLYHSRSTVLRNLVLMMEGRKPVVVRSEGMARGMEGGGNCESGHCSRSRRRQDEERRTAELGRHEGRLS